MFFFTCRRISRNGPAGFVEQDNSGKANIFAVEPKNLYVSSPRSDKAAQQGLGGSQGNQLFFHPQPTRLLASQYLILILYFHAGLLIVGGIIGVVLLVTLGIARTGGDDLGQLQQSATSLRDIAAQF